MNTRLLAQNTGTPIGNIGTGEGFGRISEFVTSAQGAVTGLSRVLSLVIGLITLAAAIYFMVQLFISGLGWISAGGDKARLEKAQNRMQHALIGLIIVVAAYALTSIISNILGIDILNLQNVLEKLEFAPS